MSPVVLYLILCLCSVLSLPKKDYIPQEVHELITAIHETCTELMGVTDDEVQNYVITDNSQKMMCYMKCLMIESKWASKDEKINYDYIIEDCHPQLKDILLPAIAKCRDIPDGTQDCEKSYNFHVCVQKADPKHWFLP